MQPIKLHIYEKTIIPVLHAKQGDIGRKFKAVITDGTDGYTIPADAVLSVWFSGASGEGNYSSIGDRSAFTVSGNTVEVELITQMLKNKGQGALCLVMNNADGSQIGTWNIPYEVEAVPGMGSHAAEQYYTALTEAATKAAESAARAESAAGVLKEGEGTDSIVQIQSEPSGSDLDAQPIATARGAVSLGRFTQANAKEAMAVNYDNKANARNSFAANSGNEVNGQHSSAFGQGNVIEEGAISAFVGGYGNRVRTGGQTVFGKHNKPDDSASFSVGDGESDDNRSNAFTVYGKDSKNGRAIELGDVLMDEATLGLVKLYTTNPAIREQIEKLIKIPQPVNTYLNQDFENGTAGVSLLGGGGTGDVREVRADGNGNHYVHLERGSSDLKIYANVAAAVDSDHVVVSVDVASTALASTHITLAGAGWSFYAVSINAEGVITSNKASSGITQSFPADGEFVNFTIAHDAAEGKYSLWIDGVQVVANRACPAGRLIWAQVSHTGNGGNAMVDNLKIYSYLKEWENPPLAVGVEYRTTERYNRNPVYTKLIDCGTLPNAAMKAVVHGATVGRILRVTGSSYGGSILSVPYRYDNSVIDISATATHIEIYTNFDTSANLCLAQIWYIKD